jgi:hypothetical protein
LPVSPTLFATDFPVFPTVFPTSPTVLPTSSTSFFLVAIV